MGHAGSKKREAARERREKSEQHKPPRSRLPEAVRQATGLSGTWCPIHGCFHSPQAATEMGCFE